MEGSKGFAKTDLLKTGASIEGIKLTKDFALTKVIVVEKVNSALVPQVTINELNK